MRALEEARGVHSNCGAKIIMTTAVTGMKEVMRSFRELRGAYLFKPIDTAELLRHKKSYQLVQ